MTRPAVSIIIINYNKPQLTFDCVRSVIEKTSLHHYEIIVLDNGSTEGSIDDIETLGPQVKLVKSTTNLGFAKGNNYGMEFCTADNILLLNNDTLLINDAVTLSLQRLLNDDKTGVVGAQLQYPDGELQLSAQRAPQIKYILIELFRLQKLVSKKAAGKLLLGTFFDHQEEVKTGWIWGTFFLFKRAVLQKLPGNKLPDDFFMYQEDMQWGIEIVRAGYDVVFFPAAKIIHLEGKNKFKNEMAQTNLNIIMDRYYGKWYHAVYRFLFKLLKFTSGSK